MKIIITSADILNNRDTVSMSGQLIDELAYSAGEANGDDLIDDEGEMRAIEYVTDGYDYERALLEVTKDFDQYQSLCHILKISEAVNSNAPKHQKHIGAYIALTYPERFAELLEAYKEGCKSEAGSYYDSTLIDNYAPKLLEDIQEAIDDLHERNSREWLHGDHQNYAGVLSLIAKYYGASEALNYDEKNGDSVTFTFDDGAAAYGYDEVRSPEEMKAHIVDEIINSIDAKHEQKKAENAKRKAERERLAAYHDEQRAVIDAKRKEKLEALNK